MCSAAAYVILLRILVGKRNELGNARKGRVKVDFREKVASANMQEREEFVDT